MDKNEFINLLKEFEKRRKILINKLNELENETSKLIKDINTYHLTKNNPYHINTETYKIELKKKFKDGESKIYVNVSEKNLRRMNIEILEKIVNNYPLDLSFVNFIDKHILRIVFYVNCLILNYKIWELSYNCKIGGIKKIYQIYENLDVYEKECEKFEEKINQLKLIKVIVNGL